MQKKFCIEPCIIMCYAVCWCYDSCMVAREMGYFWHFNATNDLTHRLILLFWPIEPKLIPILLKTIIILVILINRNYSETVPPNCLFTVKFWCFEIVTYEIAWCSICYILWCIIVIECLKPAFGLCIILQAIVWC